MSGAGTHLARCEVMFGIGAGELFVIFIIAIVVIGPRQLPEVARTIGKLFATVKRTSNSLRDQMQDEVKKFQELDEIKEFKTSIEAEMYKVQDTAETYVQKEFEAEGKRLEEETRHMEQAFTTDSGPAAPEPSIAPPAESPALPGPLAYGDATTPPASAGEPPAGTNGSSPGHAGGEPAAPAPNVAKPIS